MTRTLAIAGLTFREGIRMKIVIVFILLLGCLLLLMPFVLRGDDTLSGKLQNFLSYSFAVLSILLGLATIFFSCSTLSREFRTSSIQMVVVKPVTRFEILLGKWLGIMALNTLLLAASVPTIYGFAWVIKERKTDFDRDRLQIRDAVWTSRIASRPVVPDFTELARQNVEERIAQGQLRVEEKEVAIRAQSGDLRRRWRALDQGEYRVFEFEGMPEPDHEDMVVQVRYRARGVPIGLDEMVSIDWTFIDPATNSPLASMATTERSGEVHQFLVRARFVIREGRAVLVVGNPYVEDKQTVVMFEGPDSLQIMYKAGSFEQNLLKSAAMVLMKLAFLSAVGLFFSIFVSFPVACLCAFSFYVIGLGHSWWLESIGANLELVTPDVDPYGAQGQRVRTFLVPILQVLFPNFLKYDGGQYLVDGVTIPMNLVLQCAAHTLLFGLVLLLVPGWVFFERKQVANVSLN
jgi:hypothetical protein